MKIRRNNRLVWITCFLLLFSLLPIHYVAAGDVTVTLDAMEDSWVDDTKPDQNFGASDKFKVKRTSSGNRDAFLKFNTASVTGEVYSALFKLYVVSMESSTISAGGVYNIEVRGMTDDGWDEATLTYHNAPMDEGTIIGTITVTEADIGQYLSLDVTEFVNHHPDKIISLRLRGVESSRGADYASKEHASGHAPKLVVTYTESEEADITPPTAPTELTVAGATAAKVDLNWSASTDDSGYVIYKVYRDGVQIGETLQTFYSDQTAQPGKTYEYMVIAVDRAENASPASNTVTVTTEERALVSVTLTGLRTMSLDDNPLQATVVGVFSDSTEETIATGVTFTSSHPEVASVSSEGLVTPLSAGSTLIQANYAGFAPVTYELLVYHQYFEQTATDDTFTQNGRSANPSAVTMNIKSNSSGSDIRRAYLKFDLPVIEGWVEQASVRVFVDALEGSTPADGYDVTLYGIYDDSWDEATLEEANRPAELGIALDEVRVDSSTAGSYIAFDVTEFVNAHTDSQVSFYLQSSANVSRGAHYRTKEHSGGTPPLLTIAVADFSVPTVPTNVVAEASSKKVELTWEASDHAASYMIARSVNGEPFEVIAEVGATEFTDANVHNDVTYLYKVKAKNQQYESEYSEQVSAVPRYPLIIGTPEFSDLFGNSMTELSGAGYVNTKLEITNLTDQSYHVLITLAEVESSNGSTESYATIRKIIKPLDTDIVEVGFNLDEEAAGRAISIKIVDMEAPGHPELYHPRTYFANQY